MPPTAPHPDPRLRLAWLLFGASSLAAVLTGCWVAGAHGVPKRALVMNLAAWAVGAALAALVVRARPAAQRAWPVIAIAGLAVTFLSPGLSGVHRWIGLGPIRLNAAELFLPAALMGLAGWSARSLGGAALTLALAALLALQPDGSQALAFAGASIAALIIDGARSRGRILLVLLLLVLAAAAGLRPDALEPVAEVEGIIGLAAALSPFAAALAGLALLGAVLAPLCVIRRRAVTPAAAAAGALTIYLALAALAPAFGAFPVPLVGMGVSSILGAWLGFGVLMSLATESG